MAVQLLPAPPGMQFPAGPDDVRAVLQRLPPGVVQGLTGVVLTPAFWWSTRSDSSSEPDPLLGRPGLELLPGIFATPILGTYFPGPARIELQGYVYAETLPDRPIWELYLRLMMLQTLCHEVGHHWDWTARRAGDRWREPGAKKSEAYADRQAFTWTREYVLPYLRETYPEACRALSDWLREHGGVDPGLEQLAHDCGNPVTPPGTAAIRSLFSMHEAIDRLMREVYAGEDRNTTRREFARELHYGEYYPEALAALEAVLADTPGDPEALTLVADVYVHQERYAEARSLVEPLLAEHPEALATWKVFGDACTGLGDLQEAREAVRRCLALCGECLSDRASYLEDLAALSLELGDREEFDQCLQALQALDTRFARRLINRLLKLPGAFPTTRSSGVPLRLSDTGSSLLATPPPGSGSSTRGSQGRGS